MPRAVSSLAYPPPPHTLASWRSHPGSTENSIPSLLYRLRAGSISCSPRVTSGYQRSMDCSNHRWPAQVIPSALLSAPRELRAVTDDRPDGSSCCTRESWTTRAERRRRGWAPVSASACRPSTRPPDPPTRPITTVPRPAVKGGRSESN